MKKPVASAVCALFLLLHMPVVADEAPLPVMSINSGDRVLVVAAHPDDETLAAAGVIQAALASGAKVKVLGLGLLGALFHKFFVIHVRLHRKVKSGSSSMACCIRWLRSSRSLSFCRSMSRLA